MTTKEIGGAWILSGMSMLAVGMIVVFGWRSLLILLGLFLIRVGDRYLREANSEFIQPDVTEMAEEQHG